MTKRFAAIATLAAAVAATAGLFATPSDSAANTSYYCKEPVVCFVTLTGTGPSPSKVTMDAGRDFEFLNRDSVTHTVVFANGRCSLTVPPGEGGGPGSESCKENFAWFVGSYAYTVDGKFPGTIVTTPVSRSVTLTARTHTIRHGTRLSLHGRVSFHCHCYGAPSGRHHTWVTVLARTNSGHRFRWIATVIPRFRSPVLAGWKLTVQPGVRKTYIAEVWGQLPHGQVWTDGKSHPFTVRFRH